MSSNAKYAIGGILAGLGNGAINYFSQKDKLAADELRDQRADQRARWQTERQMELEAMRDKGQTTRLGITTTSNEKISADNNATSRANAETSANATIAGSENQANATIRGAEIQANASMHNNDGNNATTVTTTQLTTDAQKDVAKTNANASTENVKTTAASNEKIAENKNLTELSAIEKNGANQIAALKAAGDQARLTAKDAVTNGTASLYDRLVLLSGNVPESIKNSGVLSNMAKDAAAKPAIDLTNPNVNDLLEKELGIAPKDYELKTVFDDNYNQRLIAVNKKDMKDVIDLTEQLKNKAGAAGGKIDPNAPVSGLNLDSLFGEGAKKDFINRDNMNNQM